MLNGTESVYKRNVLHWAVINKERALIEVLVSRMDADRRELRQMEDSKKKKPQEYD